ncbi:MAG: MipA/OmpV family protein [Kiritimatiellae bacterium]|nr:MipA/OmpV family protein [Kiritimatiellia bacterium]
MTGSTASRISHPGQRRSDGLPVVLRKARFPYASGWIRGCAVMLSLLFASEGTAEEAVREPLPLWEMGLFFGAISLPQYSGSDEYSFYAIPLPYLIYRGEILRANRDGVRGVLLQGQWMETGLSFGGYPPVPEENDARRDMPRIGAILEGGPAVNVFLRGRDHPDPFYVALALRGVISVSPDNLDLAWRGLHGDARLVYHNHTWLKEQNISMGMNTGVDFANRRYTECFYEVASEYTTPERVEYSPSGGYAGFNAAFYINKRLSSHWLLACYYRWTCLSGAAFVDSPLVETEHNHMVGLALLWTALQSERLSMYTVE